jgi:hypothetical protein
MDGKKKKIPIIATVAALLIICAVLVVFFIQKNKIQATTMRLIRIVGEVNLTEKGKDKTAMTDIRLGDGNVLSTGIQSLVSVGLDDTKIVSLEENSRCEFHQKGKKTELMLTDGSLFFDVRKALEENESLDIKSSTMVVGIRGTSGYVWNDKAKGTQHIIITDGHVIIKATNPKTGETVEQELSGSYMLTAYLYDDGDFNYFEIKEITVDDFRDELKAEIINCPQETKDRIIAVWGTKINDFKNQIDPDFYILEVKIVPDKEAEKEPEPEASVEEQKETVTSTDKKEEVTASSASVKETESSASSKDEKKDTSSQKQTTVSVKAEKDDPPAHVHEWVTETYYTTETETRTETETQYVTVQEVVDHPEVSHEETKFYVVYPDGTKSGPYDTFNEADMVVQAGIVMNPNAAAGGTIEEGTVKVVDTQAWQETVNRSVPKEVQVTHDYEVQVPHERTYCKTCGEEQN